MPNIQFVSASKLKQFRLCPFSTTLKFKTSPQIDFGLAVHAGIAAYLKGEDYMTAYRGEAGKLGVALEEEPEAQKCFEFMQEQNIDPETVLAVESEDQPIAWGDRHNFQVPITETWGISGAIDCVYVNAKGELVIVDWKTGNTKEDDDLQLAMYALAAYKLYEGFETIITKFVYLKQGFTQTSVFNAEKLVGAIEYIAPLAEAYIKARQENKLARQCNKYCCCCQAKESCPVFKSMVETEPYKPSYYEIEVKPENLEKLFAAKDRACAIAKAAGEINACLEVKIKDLLEKMGGKVTMGGRTYEVKEKVSRYEYKLEPIFMGLSELIGRPPLEALTFTSTGANAIKKTLDKEQKKTFQAIIDSNKEIKSKSKSVVVNINSEPVLIGGEAENE